MKNVFACGMSSSSPDQAVEDEQVVKVAAGGRRR